MRERFLRGVYPEHIRSAQCELRECARNDNAQYVIKSIACVIARVFSEAISRFHNGELFAVLLRWERKEYVSVATSIPRIRSLATFL